MFDNLLDDTGPPPEKPREWSDMQKDFFHQIEVPDQDIMLEAVAGSGKTTTIIEATRYAPGSSIFMAFNKAIAEDIRSKGPAADVKTLNALGHGLMMQNRPSSKLNARKTLEILKQIMGDSSEFRDFGYTLSRIVGLGKNNCLGLDEPPDASDFQSIIDAYAFDIPVEKQSDYAVICREAFEQSRLLTAEFDFDDQLWVPLFEGWEFPHYDNAFIDECQDLSPIQHRMAQALKTRGARIVGVGDRHQAIYGFRGASVGSMDELKEMFGMIELPLSISYRCSKMVVMTAQQFCPHIRWREGAPDGDIHGPLYEDAQRFDQYMVLCRTNAPLFREILRYVRRQEPCQVLSSFLDTFQSFIRGFKTTYTSDLIAKLDRWYEKEKEDALAKNKRGKLAGLIDRYETVKLLCGTYKFTADMVTMVKSLGDSTRGPKFATIHKSKGLEHPHIYLLRPDLLGGFGDLTAEQRQQEDNLHYVAITRAEETLTYGASR
jgi:UvrD/REP helicase N-terminal domain/UvrD-like helicase C-terminal domain